ncbi:MAG: formylmethanofuran dehydrogenase subunit E family protein [Beijerinckiaceae bacterium]
MRLGVITICLFGGFLALQNDKAGAHPHSPFGDRSASNRDHFIQLGEAVHGGFGPLIALGIRIGDDAMKTLGAGPRQLDVTYHSGPQAPCPCIVDGVMIVTTASPGQGALRVSSEPAGAAEHGRIVFLHKRSGRRLEYVIPLGVARLVAEGLKGDPERRWSVIMDAPEAGLFTKRFLD